LNCIFAELLFLTKNFKIMTLIKSISGIRGTIGGVAGDNLTPIDVVKFTSAYATWVREQKNSKSTRCIIVGRDARISGSMVEKLVVATLNSMGYDVINIGLASTPTTEIAVVNEVADGGIIITASHNPYQWNALKLLNHKGEFLSASDGERILEIAEKGNMDFALIDDIGFEKTIGNYEDIHIDQILELDVINKEAIKKAGFRVVIDCVNSVGGIILPKLLRRLGVAEIIELYTEPNGMFPHNPEPLPENLTEISKTLVAHSADVGFVVDPDVDRLAIVCEDGSMFGEEYTLVAVADYVLAKKQGNTVSNLSSTRALRDVTKNHGAHYFASAVGEVNVVEKMKEVNAVIGGEGNGGVILPDLHYGRDALVGVALFLSYLAERKEKVSVLKQHFPAYYVSKNKIELRPETDVDELLEKVAGRYSNEEVTTIDGVKIDFENSWVHLRKSNTEPIIRIYAEAMSEDAANALATAMIEYINSME
jgi:phosphomannomutase